jgi:hypothetical protein
MSESRVVAEYQLALRNFLTRRHPEAVEMLELVSLRFSMSRDIAENRHREALKLLHIWSLEQSSTSLRDSGLRRQLNNKEAPLIRIDDLFLVIQVVIILIFYLLRQRQCVLQMLSEAATNFMKEHELRRAKQCLTLARLVGMQTQMIDTPLIFQSADV